MVALQNANSTHFYLPRNGGADVNVRAVRAVDDVATIIAYQNGAALDQTESQVGFSAARTARQ